MIIARDYFNVNCDKIKTVLSCLKISSSGILYFAILLPQSSVIKRFMNLIVELQIQVDWQSGGRHYLGAERPGFNSWAIQLNTVLPAARLHCCVFFCSCVALVVNCEFERRYSLRALA